MRNRKQYLALLAALLLLCTALPGFAEEDPQLYSISDLKGKRVAIQTGTNHDGLLAENEELAGSMEVSYYNNPPDMVEALKAGKADAVILDKPVAQIYCNENPELMILPEQMDINDFGIGFAKGSPYTAKFNSALAKMRENGELAEIDARWLGVDASVKVPLKQDWEPVNGTLRYWVDTTYEPMSYMGEGGMLLGYDVDVVMHAARIMGYGVEITPCNFDGLIPALVSGKADLVSSGLSITPERAESIDFSDSYYTGSVTVVVRDYSYTSSDGNFWEGLKESFEKTFIRENRWQMFLEGIGNTLLITVLAALFGTVLGFAIYMLCRKTGRKVSVCFEALFSLLERMPVIVFLMVLYYIIFGSVDISGVAVSVVAFTLTFSAAMYGMLKTGVSAVGPGQTEAAYALGYTDRKAFFKIILPQAAGICIPSYRSELISLVKGTAVVGYIAVQDLAKMGDIIRSRSYEAFFPLLTTSLIYVALTRLLTLLINHLEHVTDFRRRKPEAILKGVNVKCVK